MIQDDIKKGDKVIFIQHGGVLSANAGNVFTFYAWWPTHWGSHRFWQCQELIDEGNTVHNFAAYDCELFDPEKHAHLNPNIMDLEKLRINREQFISDFGA
jgi:hypothetical protein